MITKLKKTDLQIIALSYVSFIVIAIPGSLLGVGWPSIRQTFELPLEAVGILLLLSTVGYTLSSFFSGVVISRLGIRLSLTLGALVSAISLIGYASAGTWWFMISAALIGGFGGGIIDAGLNVFFAKEYSPRQMNWLHASFGFGAALGPLLMTYLLTSGQSWRIGYLISAILQFVLCLSFAVIFRHAKDDTNYVQEEALPKRASVSIAHTLRQPLVLLSILMFFLYAGIEVTPSQWSFSLFTEARQINEQTAGYWVSLYWLSFTLGRIFFGIIASRVNVNQSIRACLVLIMVGSVLIWWNPASIVSFIGLALIGFTLGPIFPLLISATPERLGNDLATNAIGFQVGAASFGIAVLPGLAGSFAASYGLEIIPPYLFIASLLMTVTFQLITMRTPVYALATE